MYNPFMERTEPLEAFFYATENGQQPCRAFLLALTKDDRREVGADIFAVQQGFPPFKKKSQKTPPEELETARNRLKDYRRQQQ